MTTNQKIKCEKRTKWIFEEAEKKGGIIEATAKRNIEYFNNHPFKSYGWCGCIELAQKPFQFSGFLYRIKPHSISYNQMRRIYLNQHKTKNNLLGTKAANNTPTA